MGKRKQPAPKAAPDARPVNQRGLCFEAEKLTGNRAQSGNLPGGAPRYTYEIKWKGNHKSTYEPAACLIGWEAEMKKVDEDCAARNLLPQVKPVAEAQKAREMLAKKKAEELAKRKERLLRLKARRVRMNGEDHVEEEGEEEGFDDDVLPEDEALGAEAIAAELLALERQLAMLAGGTAAAALEQEHGADEAVVTPCKPQGGARSRPGRSLVWKAFDRTTGRCTLPHPTKHGEKCNSQPDAGTGTSGEIRHLEKEHEAEWLHIKQTGERKSSSQMIEDALAAQKNQSLPALGQQESNELDRLVARWLAKCTRRHHSNEDLALSLAAV